VFDTSCGPGSDKHGGYISDEKAIKSINEKLEGLTFWVHVFIPVSPESAKFYNDGDLSKKNATLGGTFCVSMNGTSVAPHLPV
jgi:hypothetical protein